MLICSYQTAVQLVEKLYSTEHSVNCNGCLMSEKIYKRWIIMGNLAFWLVLVGFVISFNLAFKAFLEL